MDNGITTTAKPFLKWAGGKTQLLGEISNNIPFTKQDTFTYIEPFVGSGAVFFWMLNNYPGIKKAVINDINTDLVYCYQTIKNNVDELIEILCQFEQEYLSLPYHSEERKQVYYQKRDLFNKRESNKTEQSALLIFLNKTCFNGLYRVNKNNQYNVPQGNYKNPLICNETNLKAVFELLQKVEILNVDFAKTIEFSGTKSFFYFDPPYKPLSETSSFNSYAQHIFDDNEQKRLKLFCDELDKAGSKWLLSNSDVKGTDPSNTFFDDLYKNYQIKRVMAKRSINANALKRGKLKELLISNVRV